MKFNINKKSITLINAISIIGAGSYGTALAIALSRNGNNVYLWGYKLQHLKQMQNERCNSIFLPNITFPDNLFIEANLSKVINMSQDLLIVVPSHAFSEILIQIKPYLKHNSRIVWATKGLEKNTGRFLHEVAKDILGSNVPLAVISGPTFAQELANGLPTAVALASTHHEFSNDLQLKLHCGKSFRVYNNYDLVGVQLGGVVKNIIAIGTGMSDGIGFGANARTALITRGLSEMTRLGIALGANPSTFMGMAGLGDLVLTCTDNLSRNRRFGLMLGQGKNVHYAKKNIKQIVEGYINIKEVKYLSDLYNVEMPITDQIYQVLFCKKSVKEAALTLFNRESKDEIFNY